MNLSRISDQELLKTRFCDLKLELTGSLVEQRILKLYTELQDRGIRFRPHFWISTEWFSPDGIPGIAIPFYLFHPRLARLEQSQMYRVEGQQEQECMMILRHETGHAIDTAYRLSRRGRFRQLFGPRSRQYPKTYRPKPQSQEYVQHLGDWYAQSHPSEDFAETFAVWLAGPKMWRTRYKHWKKALQKLEYVDELMCDIRRTRAPVQNNKALDPTENLRRTLGRHYRTRRAYYGVDAPDFSDEHLFRIFSNENAFQRRESASDFLKGLGPEIRELVAEWTGTSPYTIEQVIQSLRQRSNELKLHLQLSDRETRKHCLVMLSVLTMTYVYSGKTRLYL